MEIRAVETPSASVLQVKGEIDITTVGEFAHELRQLAQGGGNIVVDLSNVEYLDLQGINTLEALHADLKHEGRQLVLSAVRDVHRLLLIAQVDKTLQIFSSSEEAQASLTDGTGGIEHSDISSLVVMPGSQNGPRMSFPSNTRLKPARRKAKA